jgi:hypothetical protein
MASEDASLAIAIGIGEDSARSPAAKARRE